MKKTLCVMFLAACFGTAPVLHATSFSTDQSDLWWNPNESGWGLQLVQRGSVIFATMFVCDVSGNPAWYTATLNPGSSSSTWSGDLYQTHGPWFGSDVFNTSLVASRIVGTMSWNAPSVDSGTLNYSVDGVPATKNIQRQLLVYDTYAGTYVGAVHVTTSSCSNASANGNHEAFVAASVTQTGQVVSVTLAVVSATRTIAGTITASGALTQAGQFGAVSGTYSSSVGEAGSALLSELNVQVNHLSTRVTLNSVNNGCQNSGYLAAIKSRL